jgi:hypothetical protein
MPFTLPGLQTKRKGERRREREMDKRKNTGRSTRKYE